MCGSDLWDYRGVNPVTQPTPMGHEYVGIIQEAGSEVISVKPGQFVIGPGLPPTRGHQPASGLPAAVLDAGRSGDRGWFPRSPRNRSLTELQPLVRSRYTF